MEKLGIEDVHKYVLAIAKEFDRICTEHHIPYYMVDGTMLGAVRHKGFIPWDDDMDFGVPIEYYKKLENILDKELKYPYRCCTYKNHPAVFYTFFKIEDMRTVNDYSVLRLPVEKKLGVNIDIFPLCRCEAGDKKIKKIRRKKVLLAGYFNSPAHPNSMARKTIKWFIRLITGGSPKYIQRSIDKAIYSIKPGSCIGMVYSNWKDKDIVPFDWYGKGKRYQFEDASFLGIEMYDEYLTHVYGDYMKLPPEADRIPHVDNVYLR